MRNWRVGIDGRLAPKKCCRSIAQIVPLDSGGYPRLSRLNEIFQQACSDVVMTRNVANGSSQAQGM